MALRRLIRSAPDQPATAHPIFCRCRASRDQGIPQHSGREKVAPALRIADQLSRKSAPLPCPRELRPANTTEAANTTGSSTACHTRTRSVRWAVV